MFVTLISARPNVWEIIPRMFENVRAQINIRTGVEAAAIQFAAAKIRNLKMNISSNASQKQQEDQTRVMPIVEPKLAVLKNVLQFFKKK